MTGVDPEFAPCPWCKRRIRLTTTTPRKLWAHSTTGYTTTAIGRGPSCKGSYQKVEQEQAA